LQQVNAYGDPVLPPAKQKKAGYRICAGIVNKIRLALSVWGGRTGGIRTGSGEDDNFSHIQTTEGLRERGIPKPRMKYPGGVRAMGQL